MTEWITGHESVLVWISTVSFVLLLGSLVFAIVFIVRMPVDYFVREKHGNKSKATASRNGRLALIMKNLLGYILIIAGLLMLILPGQGFLTLLIGIFLIDFPGKQKAVRWLGTRNGVFRSLNWVRRRAGRAPINK